MKNILGWKQRISDSIELRCRTTALNTLMAMPDRQLRETGISREKLKQGLNAWPWREESKSDDVNHDSTIQELPKVA